MIWDCFMLRDELDMLECRFTEMEDYDVTHVLVEANVTHRGAEKPLHYLDNKARFAPWKDRIRSTSQLSSTLMEISEPWAREHYQRDLALTQMGGIKPDDLVLISDVDEIPSAAVLTDQPAIAALVMQRVACFAVDWVWPVLEQTGVLARAGAIAGHSLAAVRDARAGYPPILDGGWHLSWMGSHEAHLSKLAAHCHTEQDVPLNLDRITGGQAYAEGWHIGTKLIPADVDGTWPRYVRERRCPASWFRPR